jgi:aminoglycoside phosphotransferase (APT) family kinase protein
MDEVGVGRGPIQDPALLGGGTQNILLRFRRGADSYVLRRPPLEKRRNSDETMRREARVLVALEGTDVPHPEIVAACGDVEVIGAAFYLMEPVDGYNVSEELPKPCRAEGYRRHLGVALADGIAALSSVDPFARGLGDLGKPERWLERQVERWQGQLDSYRGLPGYDGPDIAGIDELGAWVEANRPSEWTPGLIHGDYSFANVMLRRDVPRLAAIIDWELTTIGDPLLDLGHMLTHWPDASGRGIAFDIQAGGVGERAEAITRYAERTGRDVSRVDWYEALACFRLAAILEGTYARACGDLAPKDVGDRLHGISLRLAQRGRAIMQTAGRA